jgi:hypothetical protein
MRSDEVGGVTAQSDKSDKTDKSNQRVHLQYSTAEIITWLDEDTTNQRILFFVETHVLDETLLGSFSNVTMYI